MKTLIQITLAIFAAVCLSAASPAETVPAVPNPHNIPQIMEVGPLLGEEVSKLYEELGEGAITKNGCAVVLVRDGQPAGYAQGDRIDYEFHTDGLHVTRNACVIKNVIVGERHLILKREGGKVFRQETTITDGDLALELLDLGPEDLQLNNPDGPEI